MLGLVEHPGDEDGEMVANPTPTSDPSIQATFLFLSRQRLASWRKVSARSVQHHPSPISFRFMNHDPPSLILSVLLTPIINHVVAVFDVQQFNNGCVNQYDFSVGQDLQI